MEIIHISAECYPVAKVGGLGDVVGALPKYQNKLGHIAKVVMPAYETKFMKENEFEVVYDGWGNLGFQDFPSGYSERKPINWDLTFSWFTLLISPTVHRYMVILMILNVFLLFKSQLLDWIAQWEHLPDVVHCHDHHTGLVPFMMSNCFRYRKLITVPTVLTIHNAQYQGQFGWDKLNYIPAFDSWKSGQLDWKGAINPLASAIKCAWRVTTVSPSYLDEISYHANGLEDLLAQERGKSFGILNGIDNEVWNPASDAMLEKTYTIKNYRKGKKGKQRSTVPCF